MNSKIAPIDQEQYDAMKRTEIAIEAYKTGEMVILVDDENRENEGDLAMAAEFATPEAVNFMAKFARGLICLSLTESKTKELELPMMVSDNTSQFETAFTISIDAKKDVTTGISAQDRSNTILAAINDNAKPCDLARPGHIFPLQAKDGGVLVRTGQTEGSIDLSVLAGLKPAAVICEIMNDDGTMSRMPQLEVFSKTHNIPIVSIADIIRYRMQEDCLVRRGAVAELPIADMGNFKIVAYENKIDNRTHIALLLGEINQDAPTLVRVHSECLTGDVFGSARCDCGDQLQAAIKQIEREGGGVLLYIRQAK
jgi:3,4-dihydroxy 2-butanone 4-phosphate synthase / GTP cyclohydrolase II